MLFITYQAINYKTYDKSDIDIGQLNLDEELDEEIPITEQLATPPPPPPPPAAPEVIEVVEDEEEVEETVIESTETDMEEEIIEVEEVEVEEVEEDIEVPFAVIENVPVYPGCEKGNNAAKKACMSEKISKFVQKKFNTELAGELRFNRKTTYQRYFQDRQKWKYYWHSFKSTTSKIRKRSCTSNWYVTKNETRKTTR